MALGGTGCPYGGCTGGVYAGCSVFCVSGLIIALSPLQACYFHLNFFASTQEKRIVRYISSSALTIPAPAANVSFAQSFGYSV
jgi:hypothetical protein